MTLFRLIERNLEQRKLATTLTALSVALGVMLVTSILLLRDEMERTYGRQGRGYGMVVGPTGSPLQLVLNSVYHLERSPGLISHHVWRELAGEDMRRWVRLAVPYAVGDSFRGYRVVATTDAVFRPQFPYPEAATTAEKFSQGGPFHFHPEALDEALAELEGRVPVDGQKEDPHAGHSHGDQAVLGAEVAGRLGLGIGDRIEPTHGVEGGKEHDHEHLWTVCGVLKRTGTAIDRVVFINLDSFYRIGDHAGALLPNVAEKTAGLSAVLVFPRRGMAKARLLPLLNKRSDIQVADVAAEVRKLMSLVGNVDQIFLLVAVLVVAIGVSSIMVAIYNTMNERRRELAIMRAIGARRLTVFGAIIGESTTIAFTGGVLGVLLGHALVAASAGYLAEIANMQVRPLRVLQEELLVLAAVGAVGALAGILPALKAYRTDVAANLVPLS